MITMPDRSRIIVFAGFILALIAAIELGTGHAVDPSWLGYGALAAVALALAAA